MSISTLGLTRANGKIYVQLRLPHLPEGTSLRASASTSVHSNIPCALYPDGQDTYVAVLPVLNTVQTLELCSCDAAGHTTMLYTKRIHPIHAKWESRARSVLDKPFTQHVRSIDKRFQAQESHIEITCIYQDEKEFVYRGNMYIVPDDPIANPIAVCYCANGSLANTRFVVVSEYDEQPMPSVPWTRHVVEFTLRAKAVEENRIFVLEDEYTAAERCATKEGSSSASTGPYGARFSTLEYFAHYNMGVIYEHEILSAQHDPNYNEWFELHRITPAELEIQRSTQLDISPTFSLVVPLYKTPLPFFRELVDSVCAQSYPHWELLLVNASPEERALTQAALAAAQSDSRIRVLEVERNGGISYNSNVGIQAATGDFVCFVDHDDLIEPNILFEYAAAINRVPTSDLLYCDEDKLNQHAWLYNPYFKPDFNLDMLRCHNYICHMLCIRRSLLDSIGLFDSTYDGAQDYDLTLRASEHARAITHVPYVLYHWRANINSTASNPDSKPYTSTASARALQAHFDRLGMDVEVEETEDLNMSFARYKVPEHTPLVSIIVAAQHESKALEHCIRSILTKSTYPNYEVIVVGDEGNCSHAFKEELLCTKAPRIHFVDAPDKAMRPERINRGTQHAQGQYLLLLLDDTEITTDDWIERLLGVCARNDVGCVGAKLIYADGTVEQAGLSISKHGLCYRFHGLGRKGSGYFNFDNTRMDVSAISSDCLMLASNLFHEIGGMDEALVSKYGDVDLCFRISEKKLLVVYTPDVEIVHHIPRQEHFDVGEIARDHQEAAVVMQRWPQKFSEGDPCHHGALRKDPPRSYFFALPDMPHYD